MPGPGATDEPKLQEPPEALVPAHFATRPAAEADSDRPLEANAILAASLREVAPRDSASDGVNGASPAVHATDKAGESSETAEGASTRPRTLGLSQSDLVFVSAMLAAILILSVFHLVKRYGWRPTEIAVLHSDRDYRFTIDINTATWVEWLQLEGIGETLARRIVEYREQHGPFQSIDDLDNVRGIGPATLDKMRPYLTCRPQTDDPQ